MGVYIKGMDMPTNCTDCYYRPLVGCNPYQDNGLSPSDHRHRTCPLTEVAEPHGDLVDHSEIGKILIKALDECEILEADKKHVIRAVWTAPTIIEGEVE